MMATARELSFHITAETAAFEAAMRELAAGLKTRRIFERFPQSLLDELEDALAGGLIGESVQFVTMPAGGALDVRIEIKVGGLLERCIAAVRALRAECEGDFSHSEPPCES